MNTSTTRVSLPSGESAASKSALEPDQPPTIRLDGAQFHAFRLLRKSGWSAPQTKPATTRLITFR